MAVGSGKKGYVYASLIPRLTWEWGLCMLEVERREMGYLQLSFLEGTDHHLQAAVAHVHKRNIARFFGLSWQILLVKPIRKGSWRSD